MGLLNVLVCAIVLSVWPAAACPEAWVYPNLTYESDGTKTLSWETQMALLACVAGNTNDFAEITAGWPKIYKLAMVSGITGDTDKYALWQRDNKCVIGAGGTNSGGDFKENLDVAGKTYCGFAGVHSGAAKEVEGLVTHPDWKRKWQPYLAGSNCRNGVTVVGHSLGGAQASIIAACANNGSTPYGFTVEALYTYGAFAPADPPLVNNKEQDGVTAGCFKGARYFNSDSANYDLVPAITVRAGYRHPQVQAVLLSRRLSTVKEADVEIYTYPCKSTCAFEYPANMGGFGSPSVIDHLMRPYISRISDWKEGAHYQAQWTCGGTSKVHPEVCPDGTDSSATGGEVVTSTHSSCTAKDIDHSPPGISGSEASLIVLMLVSALALL